MNVNLAPVLDVYRTAGDFDDQLQRSYSNNPARVAQLGAAFITAQQAAGRGRHRQALPGPRRRHDGHEHRHAPGEARPAARHAARRRRGALPGGHRRGREARHGALGDLPGAGSRNGRPACRRSWWAASCAAASDFTRRDHHRRPRAPTRCAPSAPSRARAVLAAGAGMDLLLCAGKRADEGSGAAGALAAALAGRPARPRRLSGGRDARAGAARQPVALMAAPRRPRRVRPG